MALQELLSHNQCIEKDTEIVCEASHRFPKKKLQKLIQLEILKIKLEEAARILDLWNKYREFRRNYGKFEFTSHSEALECFHGALSVHDKGPA